MTVTRTITQGRSSAAHTDTTLTRLKYATMAAGSTRYWTSPHIVIGLESFARKSSCTPLHLTAEQAEHPQPGQASGHFSLLHFAKLSASERNPPVPKKPLLGSTTREKHRAGVALLGNVRSSRATACRAPCRNCRSPRSCNHCRS